MHSQPFDQYDSHSIVVIFTPFILHKKKSQFYPYIDHTTDELHHTFTYQHISGVYTRHENSTMRAAPKWTAKGTLSPSSLLQDSHNAPVVEFINSKGAPAGSHSFDAFLYACIYICLTPDQTTET